MALMTRRPRPEKSRLALALLAALFLFSGPMARAEEAVGGFWERFIEAYKTHLAYTGEEVPETPFRGAPPPLESPPWPGEDYAFGGSQVIGHTAPYGGPLNDAIYGSDWGRGLKDANITLYGWIEPGLNFSTATNKFSISQGMGGNYPMTYGYTANRPELNQFAFYVERVPDEVQTDHMDWGFRFTSIYGQDYKYTFAHDNGSSQYLKDHHMYGYDICLMCYAELYIPWVAEGMQIRTGRYISIPDVEAQLAPNNYTYTHSLLYAYDPYTHTGIVDTIKLSRNWVAQVELSAGNDIMAWDSRYAQLTPGACLQWTSDDGGDVIYPCINGINNKKYGYNNVQDMVMSWYKKFDDRWHTDFEFWYMWQKETPNINWNGIGVQPIAPILGSNGAYCNSARPSCYAREFAFVNYLNYQIDHLNAISLRNEFFNDVNGQRTGIPTWYSEHAIGWQHWIGDVITIRPEVSFAKSYNQNAFNASAASMALGPSPLFPNGVQLGTQNHLLMFSADAIIHF